MKLNWIYEGPVSHLAVQEIEGPVSHLAVQDIIITNRLNVVSCSHCVIFMVFSFLILEYDIGNDTSCTSPPSLALYLILPHTDSGSRHYFLISDCVYLSVSSI